MNKAIRIFFGSFLLFLSVIIAYSAISACMAVVYESCTANPGYSVAMAAFAVAAIVCFVTAFEMFFDYNNKSREEKKIIERFTRVCVIVFGIVFIVFLWRV